MDPATPSSPSWKVAFYADRSGESPVIAFLAQAPAPDRARIVRRLGYLAEAGPALGMPHARRLTREIWELRAHRYRVLYAQTGRRFVMLHVFRKMTRKTPPATIDRARRRLDDLLVRDEHSRMAADRLDVVGA